MSSPTDNLPPPASVPRSRLSARLENYIGIGRIPLKALYCYVGYLWADLRRGHLSVLFGRSNRELHDQAFADWYSSASHDIAQFEATTAVPALVASAHGIVLDLGPGAGTQLARFDAARVEHIYGVEPNTAFRRAFVDRLQAAQVGLDGKYTLIPCGVEEEEVLARYGLGEGSVDCIVSAQVLCSLPDLEEQLRRMHVLLKPGGELIFWEHCRSADPVTRAVQWLWCLLWPSVIGGCRLDRVTRDALVRSADWDYVEVDTDEEAHMVMPRIWGKLVKPRAS